MTRLLVEPVGRDCGGFVWESTESLSVLFRATIGLESYSALDTIRLDFSQHGHLLSIRIQKNPMQSSRSDIGAMIESKILVEGLDTFIYKRGKKYRELMPEGQGGTYSRFTEDIFLATVDPFEADLAIRH